MDPIEEHPVPPPAPVAASFPPAPVAASFTGPTVFVLSPLPGNPYEVDRYFYSPAADVTGGDYAALLSFAADYGYPIAIYQCPDLAEFQVQHPTTVVRPFAEVPPPYIRRGYELLASSAASSAPPRGDLVSLLSYAPPAPSAPALLRGNDPPSFAATTRTSSTVLSSAGFGARPLPRAPSARPDPDGVDAPPPFMGGMGGPRFYGRSSSSYGLPPVRSSVVSGFSTSSAAEYYRQYNFPGPVPEAIPQVVFGGGRHPPPPSHHGGFLPASALPCGHHHATASVASPAAFAASPHRPLSHEDLSASSTSDLTMSFPPSIGFPAAVPLAPPPAPTRVPAPFPVPASGGVASPPPVPSPPVVVTPLRPSSETFKLPPLKDPKAYLDVYDMILYWLRQPEYGTQLSDESLLVTTPSNVAASLFWEGQIRTAVREGSLRFLFDNKGTLYHGKGFEMLDVLNKHCRPDTIANAFGTLLSLFNDVQGPSEPVLEFRSRFDGMVLDMSRSKIVLPPILLVMLFLRALHSRYSDILDQFRSRYKNLETATIDSVVEDARYHDEFKLVGSEKKTPATPKAATANVDKAGKEWASPFEWLSTYASKGLKTRWDRAIAGTGICPICHRAEKPWHVPANCPLLKELNLKLVNGPRAATPGSAPPATPAPAPAAPAPAPSPGGKVAFTDDRSVSGSVGSPSAPSGLMASVADEDFDSDQEFRWAGDESGLEFSLPSSRKSNASVAPYPSCSHVSVTSSSPSLLPSALVSRRSTSLASSDTPPSISSALQSLLSRLSTSSISPDSYRRLAVADSGATDHMFPDKSAFISYKSTSHLKVRMGNNSHLPVLARGSAIISLNGQRVLVRNALHVPGLAMPLYSLRAHFQQPGCGFLGTNDVGMLVYFPSFVLSADTSSDCTLSYEPLGRSAPLSTLHYVQPRCRPSLYPSETSLSSTTVSTSPALIEDDGSVAALVPPDSSSTPPVDLAKVASQLQSIAASVLPPPPPALPSHPVTPPPTHVLLSTMSLEEISRLLHHHDTSFPAVRPCDTANASDTKTHWSSEEIHRIMGCRKFRNYKHVLDVSRGGEWVDGG